MLKTLLAGAALAFTAATAITAPATAATEGERVQVTGEVIDSWCYFSGVMGGPEAVTGTSHHTCALWCAAGGIPVGILADDGKVYMVLKWKGNSNVADGTSLLSVQSHRLTADGVHYERDGINYILVENIVNDEGIVYKNHEDYGFVPPFAQPKQ
ncbi:hypothetical protein H2509_11155 [Stappia sp. F7233]|uniref:Uncharacterized protein n=1 Tax=Stappia albiluteola TaxID=2758565 RepID=A0A839ADQ9_9HYPH|nr:hypothetical protein [Stappia albiluteola]MBA5777681.1 hypothetical protein [Stappia albiluteola]